MPKGGSRKGAGRPPSPYGPAKRVWVPEIWLEEFREWLAKKKES